MQKPTRSPFKRFYLFYNELPRYPALFVALILLTISTWAIVGYTAAMITAIVVQVLVLLHDWHYSRFVERQEGMDEELYDLLEE